MRLSQVWFVRGNQRLFLQGMIHVGPKRLYRRLQKELTQAVKRGSLVFYEGTGRRKLETPITKNEVKIRRTFSLLLDFYPVFAKMFQVTTQQTAIRYPANAINADISFSTFSRLLDEAGFTCNFMLLLLGRLSGLMATKHTAPSKKQPLKHRDLNTAMDAREKRFGRIFDWLFMRKALPIMLDHRNQVAVAKIKRRIKERNAFVHYGEAHVPGLVQLLTQDGWTVERTSSIDLGYYTKKIR